MRINNTYNNTYNYNNTYKTSKAQASIEFFMVISVALLIFSAVIYSINQSMIASDQGLAIASSQRAVQQLKTFADAAFYHGSPSESTVYVFIPQSAVNFSAANKTIMIRIQTNPYTDVYAITKGNLSPTHINFGSGDNHTGYLVFKVNVSDDNIVGIYKRE